MCLPSVKIAVSRANVLRLLLLWLVQRCVCLMFSFNCRTDFERLFHNYNENVSNFTRQKLVNGFVALSWPTT